MMNSSNLSKIKPKLRTEGRVSGNFGRNKVRAGSTLLDIGFTNSETVKITKRDEYIHRMLTILNTSNDSKMKDFAQKELHRLNYFKETRIIQKSPKPFKGPPGV